MANNILKFADTATNILSQGEYAADAERNSGNIPGVARSKLVNKAARQSAYMANALAEFLIQQVGGDVLDDNDSAVLIAKMTSALFNKPINESDLLLNCSIAASVAANALTISVKDSAGSDCSATSAAIAAFGSASLTTPTYTLLSLVASLSITIPNTATMGQLSGVSSEIYAYLINDSGTLRIGVCRLKLPEDQLYTTVTVGTGSDLSTVLYSSGNYSNIRIRCIGKVVNSQASTGVWASAPSAVISGKFSQLPPQVISCGYTSGSGQSIPDNTITNILFGSREYDVLQCYDPATGVFTAPIAGKFEFYFLITLATTTTFSGIEPFDARISKSPVSKRNQTYPNSSNTPKVADFYGVFDLVAGDTVPLQCRQSSGGALPLEASSEFNYMSIQKVS